MTASDSLATSASGDGLASSHPSGLVGSGESGALLPRADGEDDVEAREETHGQQEDGSDERHPDIDGGWAWVICFASFFANFLLDGVLFSFGVIMLELLDYFEDSKSKTAWVGSALLGLSIAMGKSHQRVHEKWLQYTCTVIAMGKSHQHVQDKRLRYVYSDCYG